MCRRKKILKENGRFFVLRTKSTEFYTKFRLPLDRCHMRNIDIHQCSKASLNSTFFEVYCRYIYWSINRFPRAQRIFYDARFFFQWKMLDFASKYLYTFRCVAHQSKRRNESFRMMCIGFCILNFLLSSRRKLIWCNRSGTEGVGSSPSLVITLSSSKPSRQQMSFCMEKVQSS